jgi:rhomboid family protein
MIPLRDENPSESVPVVTRALIALNCAAFFYEVALGPAIQRFLFVWGMVPLRVTQSLREGSEPLVAAGLPLLTSMFLHGGWTHLIGNMWYLWIFGDNVEDRLGSLRFLLFYLASGLAAGLLHFFFNPLSRVPTVGASGAIAGVLGAYLLAFPHARVITLVPLFPFFQLMALPAALVLGLWFVFQFFIGTLALAWTTATTGGTAWWGHIGGFVFGFVAMMLLGGRRQTSRVWVE